jgi:glycosyltransferase involved in cell wall biosynthesis
MLTKTKLIIAVPGDRYPTRFNTPRMSQHIIRPTTFLPTHRISARVEGLTVFWPARSDLIHAINRIPMATNKNWVISFEAHLPRCYGGEGTKLFKYMRRRLAAPTCRKIIAWSEYAKTLFLATHRGVGECDELAGKLTVVYPNIILPQCEDEHRAHTPPLTIVFVGSHFGRKGGAVAVRAAEVARQRRLPLHFHIISSLEAGGRIWSDPQDRAFFDRYFKLLQAPNVTFDMKLQNWQVIEALRSSDFSILATLSDSFGLSAIESLSVGTPVIVTPQGALPEFIVDGDNGLILPLEVDAYGDWIHLSRSDKDSRRFEQLYRDEIERLAHALIERLSIYCESPVSIATMRKNARSTAENFFDSQKTSPILDKIYEDSVYPKESRYL